MDPGKYVFMYLFAIPGPIFPIINTEAMVVVQATTAGNLPWLMVACAAAGHVTLYVILHAVGEKTLHRWAFLSKKLNALTEAQREKFKNSTTAGFVVGGLLGLPPVVLLAPLASSLGYSRALMAVITFACRLVRFGILVSAGNELRAWFGI